MKILHVVVTENFAGVEKYVLETANEMSSHGHDVSVIGGRTADMRTGLDPRIEWWPGPTPLRAVKSMLSRGRQDVCHVHMTHAESIAALLKPLYGSVVTTRHFAKRRGGSRLGRCLAGMISVRMDHEIAISQYVAEVADVRRATVLLSGVRLAKRSWSTKSRTVLVMQRLEREKATETALEIWKESRLASEGWRLLIAGDGSQRSHLERIVARQDIPSVDFAGWVADVDGLIANAGILLATTPVEAFGLSVVEAMMRGVPVVAVKKGGHLETLGMACPELLFEPDNIAQAARLLFSLADHDDLRQRSSDLVHSVATRQLDLGKHVSRLMELYGQMNT